MAEDSLSVGGSQVVDDFHLLLCPPVRTLHTALTDWTRDRLEDPSHGAPEEIPQVRFYILHLCVSARVCVCDFPKKAQDHKRSGVFAPDLLHFLLCLSQRFCEIPERPSLFSEACRPGLFHFFWIFLKKPNCGECSKSFRSLVSNVIRNLKENIWKKNQTFKKRTATGVCLKMILD